MSAERLRFIAARNGAGRLNGASPNCDNAIELVQRIAIIALGLVAWATDWVTLQGERTIYTVECVAGRWDRTLLTPQFRTEPPNALVLKVS